METRAANGTVPGGGEAMRHRQTGPWLRLACAGLATALALVLTGDSTRAQSTVSPLGQDPLQVLDLQVKANAVIVLDTSGSMAWSAEAAGTPDGISQHELGDDDPNSKLAVAKSVLTDVIKANEGKVKFRVGRYAVPSGTPTRLTTNDRFYYATTDAAAATMSVNSGDNGASDPGVSRASDGSDDVTIGGTTWYYLTAGRWWNGQTIDISTTPPTVLGGTVTKTNPATVTLQNGTQKVTFTYKSGNRTKGGNCPSGFQEIAPLPDCSVTDQLTGKVADALRPDLLIDSSSGDIVGYEDGTLGAAATSWPSAGGMKAHGGTPISASLEDIRTDWWDTYWPTISSDAVKPRTFVVVLTDGDESCVGGTDDEKSLTAAYSAQLLRTRKVTGVVESGVTTYVVVFGGAAETKRGNWIAWGGDGLVQSNDGTRWTTTPTTTDTAVIACKNAGGCHDAFTAQKRAELIAALQTAIDQGSGSGQFAASTTITENVWEFKDKIPDLTAAEKGALTVDDAFVPVAFQPSFDASNFNGKLTAYADLSKKDETKPLVTLWEAGAKLKARVVIPAPPVAATFTDLHANAGPGTIGDSTAMIKRRIFTSSRNGVFTGTGQQAVALWPPSTSVAPLGNTSTNPEGTLDRALGLAGTGDQAEFDALRARFGACKGTNAPASCSSSSAIAVRVARARREAREMILAFTAGATIRTDDNNLPRRVASGTKTGELLYKSREWLLAETTLATPAVVAPPILPVPKGFHQVEYEQFEGTRTNTGFDDGLGLRYGNNSPTNEPVATMVYVASNQMLHAFRAGPCILDTACKDTGGEEVWGFVPFDQLGKLADRMKGQTRKDHTYMLAASLRFDDVFVPDPDTSTSGKWRTLLLFGRGIGGKYLTALDITNPISIKRDSMSDDIVHPPLIFWNRGNPDTQDGTAGGAANHSSFDSEAYAKMGQTWSVPAIAHVNPPDNRTARKTGGVEFAAYVGSGYSATKVADQKPAEGSTIFALDVLTGDVIGYYDVGDRAGMTFENAIVASPAVFQSRLLSNTFVSGGLHPAEDPGLAVYVGDIHGRLWAFPTMGRGDTDLTRADSFVPLYGRKDAQDFQPFADFGSNQPIGTAVALLSYDSSDVVTPVGASSDAPAPKRPHIYVTTGNDTRVTPPGDKPPWTTTPPFGMWGLRDDGLLTKDVGPIQYARYPIDALKRTDPASDEISGPAVKLFREVLTNDPAPGFRGTVQPLTAFVTGTLTPRVFFGATRFTPAGTDCTSKFDSRLYALTGAQGKAAFNLGSPDNKFLEYTKQLIQQIQLIWTPEHQGVLSVSKGLPQAGESAPRPPRPPRARKQADMTGAQVYTREVRSSSPVCQ